MLPVSKLAEIRVQAASLLLVVAADLCLEPGVTGGARSLADDGGVELETGVVDVSSVVEGSVGIDRVGHPELRRVELLPDHQIGHPPALLEVPRVPGVDVPERRIGLVVEEELGVIVPESTPNLGSTWSGMEGLGHGAASGRGGASPGA